MRLRTLIVCFCFLAAPVAVCGQEAGAYHDFYFVKETSPYLQLSNPAAVSTFTGHVSMAELAFRKDNGGLISLEESPDSYKGGAETESYISISDKISFHGKISWSYFSGRDMGGQILMDPSYNPVNFLESDETTIGRKNREEYVLVGDMAYKLSDSWALGCGVEYVSADQTKVKDPRFNSVWMDLGVRAGFTFRPSENSLFGMALVYRNTLEQLRGGIYGTTDKQYFVLTDKGGFYGTLDELAGDYNKIPTTETRPMSNSFYGAAFQLVSGSLSNELEVLWRDGYYGKQASASATFFKYSGVRAVYRGKLFARTGADLHRASWGLNYELLGNDENLFRFVTPTGENTYVDYTGKNHIMDRHQFAASLGYTWDKGVEEYMPSFTAGVSASGRGYMLSTVLYPFYRNASCVTVSADAFVRKNVKAWKGYFSLQADASFRTGFGNPRDDGAYASTSSTSIKSFDGYLNRQFEYDTAPAAGAALALIYTHRFTDKLAPYVKLSDTFTSLLAAPEYLSGRFRNIATITIGCNF